MKKELSTAFDARQFMQSADFEIFYYHDVNINHISFHHHDFYEFFFFLEGDVDYQIDGISYALQYGDCLLIPPGIPHRPVFHSREIPYRRFVLWLSADFYQSLCQISGDFSYGFDHAASHHTYHVPTDFITCQNIQGKLMELIEEKNGKKAFHELHVRMSVSLFLLQINRLLYDALHCVSPTYENALYLNLCDYINNHLEEDLSLDQLAAFFFVSKYHISHSFKDNMGISLHQYILKKRLQAIKNGILSGTPFNQLIYQYGFHDYTSFYRAFKKEFGSSPTEFREQHQLPPTTPLPF